MKKLILTLSLLLSFGFMSAQTDPKEPQPVKPPMPQKDTMSTNTQIQKESDLKTMDAVKTQNHPKTIKKGKKTSRDTIPKKNTRRK